MFTSNELHVLAGQKKADILRQVEKACQNSGLSLHLHVKPKKESGSEQMKAVINAISASADTAIVGTPVKVNFRLHYSLS